MKNVMMMVLRGLKRENDSVKVIGSKEVGRAVEESNVMDSIIVVVFDTRLLRESRQIEIDFVNQLVVYYRRPRQWALSSSVFPTRRVDARKSSKCVTINVMTGTLETNQLEYRSRLCEKELKRWGSDVECVKMMKPAKKQPWMSCWKAE